MQAQSISSAETVGDLEIGVLIDWVHSILDLLELNDFGKEEIKELSELFEFANTHPEFVIRMIKGFDWLIRTYNQIPANGWILEILPHTRHAKQELGITELPRLSELLAPKLSNVRAFHAGTQETLELSMQGHRQREWLPNGFDHTSEAIGSPTAPTTVTARTMATIGHLLGRISYRLVPALAVTPAGKSNNKENFVQLMDEMVKLALVGEIDTNYSDLVMLFCSAPGNSILSGIGWISAERAQKFAKQYKRLKEQQACEL